MGCRERELSKVLRLGSTLERRARNLSRPGRHPRGRYLASQGGVVEVKAKLHGNSRSRKLSKAQGGNRSRWLWSAGTGGSGVLAGPVIPAHRSLLVAASSGAGAAHHHQGHR